jgi:acylphosphatase
VTAPGPPRARLTAWVDGRVQGVGFRWWVMRQAEDLGLSGIATNLDDGRVEVIAEGGELACRELLALLRGGGTPGRVTHVTERWAAPQGGYRGFTAR